MSKTVNKLSAKERILNALKKGNNFTTNQARRIFGIENVAARIDELRKEGHCIYTNTKTTNAGHQIYVYRLGTPTRSMVKAALRSGFSFRSIGNVAA